MCSHKHNCTHFTPYKTCTSPESNPFEERRVPPPLMTDWPQCGNFPPQPGPTSAFNYSNHASEKTQSNAPPAIRVWPIFARPIAYHQGARQPGRFCRSVASRGQDAVKVWLTLAGPETDLAATRTACDLELLMKWKYKLLIAQWAIETGKVCFVEFLCSGMVTQFWGSSKC